MALNARVHSFVLECPDPPALAAFYSELTGWPVVDTDPEWSTIRETKDSGMRISFQQAPGHQAPTWPDPASSMQFHIDFVTSQHTLRIPAAGTTRELAHTTTTGRIVLRQESLTDGAFDGLSAKAEVFLTAYTLDGADPANRPVTFAFNGMYVHEPSRLAQSAQLVEFVQTQ